MKTNREDDSSEISKKKRKVRKKVDESLESVLSDASESFEMDFEDNRDLESAERSAEDTKGPITDGDIRIEVIRND